MRQEEVSLDTTDRELPYTIGAHTVTEMIFSQRHFAELCFVSVLFGTVPTGDAPNCDGDTVYDTPN